MSISRCGQFDAYAVLVDNQIHNYARKLAFQINEKFNTGFIAARLPQHVSLGPVFEVKDIKELEWYFDELAKSIMPFEVNITKIDLKIVGNDNDGLGVLWMDVKESSNLRNIYNKIDRDLSERSLKVDKIPNNETYHFHSTISLGEQPVRVYKEIFKEIDNKEINKTSKVNEIVLFISTDDEGTMGTYITYKILTLGL